MTRRRTWMLAAATTVAGCVVPIDHKVEHVSTVPANAGETIHLNVREFRPARRDQGKAVLMLHGVSVPGLVGYDLRVPGYEWAMWLAVKGGLDVFVLDLQGSGISHRPEEMSDPCNAPAADQARVLVPHQIPAICPPSYPFQLVNARSDWDELDTVVEFIRRLRGVEKVHLVAWSAGAARVGPYSVMHPEKVESLLLLAPIYNPAVRSGTGPDGFDPPVPLPQPGTPMTLRTRADLMATWDVEPRCEGQVEEGIQDRVWEAIMENDDLGSTWGPPPAGAPAGSAPEGVMRVRSPFLWGWNQGTAERVTVPLLIVQGEFDAGAGGVQRLAELYDTARSATKLRLRLQCAGHYVPWESQRGVVHRISREWLLRGTVSGLQTGEYWVDTDGELSPCLRPAAPADPTDCLPAP